MTADEPEHELRSFGRRRGRKPSARQQMLIDEAVPRLSVDLGVAAPVDLARLFDTAMPVREVWLEIGFGGAEHLLWQAEHHPEAGIIGCEPFMDGVVKAVDAAISKPLRNVRVHPDDARDLIRWLPDASIARAFILFPDPWPKRKHVKRRLVSKPTLDLLARALKPGAELRVGTDIGDYMRTLLLAVTNHPAFSWPAECPDDWRVRGADWPETRYEAKAHREGRRCAYFRFRRV